MAVLLALTLLQHLIGGFHNRDLRGVVTDLHDVTAEHYTDGQMTYAQNNGQSPDHTSRVFAFADAVQGSERRSSMEHVRSVGPVSDLARCLIAHCRDHRAFERQHFEQTMRPPQA